MCCIVTTVTSHISMTSFVTWQFDSAHGPLTLCAWLSQGHILRQLSERLVWWLLMSRTNCRSTFITPFVNFLQKTRFYSCIHDLGQTHHSTYTSQDHYYDAIWSHDVIDYVTIRLPFSTLLYAPHKKQPAITLSLRDIWPQRCGHTYVHYLML